MLRPKAEPKRGLCWARPDTRTKFGLPEQGFVYCCFNNSHKIEPVMFDVWMRALKHTPDSVPWRLSSNESIIHNLRREAVQRGVAADRLVFASVLPVEEHLARNRLADLFPDTLYFNAVTTAADALWACVPVLTYPGSTFISRWAASMLKAIGLDDMVAESLETYEERACDLAKHPEALVAIKQRLDSNRLTQPLFDTKRYVRQLETAYQTIVRKLRPGTSWKLVARDWLLVKRKPLATLSFYQRYQEFLRARRGSLLPL